MDDYYHLLHLCVPPAIMPLVAQLDKTAAALAHVAGGSPLVQLRKAKRYSDSGMYDAKHAILRRLLADTPADFDFDDADREAKYVGMTHRPTGFKIHGPRSLRPVSSVQHSEPLPQPAAPLATPLATNPTNELKDLLSLEKSVGTMQDLDAKTAADSILPAQHVLVAGYSGAGKTTYANQLAGTTGMPIVHLDDHPLWKEWKNTDVSKMKRKKKNAIRKDYNQRLVADTLANVKVPSIIEGVRLFHGDPALLATHRRVLIDTPFQTIIDQRLRRDRAHETYGLQAMGLPEEEWRQRRIAKAKVSPGIYRRYAKQWRDDPAVEIRTVDKMAADNTLSDPTKSTTHDKPYRDRVEVYALKDGKVWGGLHDNGTFGTYGGGIDEGESLLEAAAREFSEESGYTVTNLRTLGLKPFLLDWKPPYPNKKMRERARHYRGSRTYYLVGDLGDKHGRKLVEPVRRQDVRLYDLDEAIKLSSKKLTDETLAQVTANRVLALKAIKAELSRQANADKRGEDCPPGECCPHCAARLERSDDGVCNTCGKDWPDDKEASDYDDEIAGLLLDLLECRASRR